MTTNVKAQKSALHIDELAGNSDVKSAQKSTQQGAETMNQPTRLPSRFHEIDGGIYVANAHRDTFVTAEEAIMPHEGTGLDPALNLEVSVTLGTVSEVRTALTSALDWLHCIEAQLPGGNDVAVADTAMKREATR